jgi:threonine dehydratase
MTTTMLPTEADVTAAAERIAPYTRRTPMLAADVDGRPVVFKLEHLQRTGSFKFRGALNALLIGPRPDRVVTASGGNHGIAVGLAAKLLGIPATVYVPEIVPAGKARLIEETGARLMRHSPSYAEAAAAARAAADDMPGVRYIPAYDDPAVIAGQATVAAEVVADRPDVDTIAVAVGGGGLVSGTVLGAGGRPVVGVEPDDCCSLNRALAAGTPVEAPADGIAASALGSSRVGALPFAVLGGAGVTSVLVSEAEIVAALDRLWAEFRLAVEPAAAVPFAAWLAGRVPGDLACIVLCGGNHTWSPR